MLTRLLWMWQQQDTSDTLLVLFRIVGSVGPLITSWFFLLLVEEQIPFFPEPYSSWISLSQMVTSFWLIINILDWEYYILNEDAELKDKTIFHLYRWRKRSLTFPPHGGTKSIYGKGSCCKIPIMCLIWPFFRCMPGVKTPKREGELA